MVSGYLISMNLPWVDRFSMHPQDLGSHNFHPKGLILGKMWYRGPKALFGWFRNCLKLFYGLFVVGFMAWFVKCPWHAQSMV